MSTDPFAKLAKPQFSEDPDIPGLAFSQIPIVSDAALLFLKIH
jgi:hypothetical protein